MHSTAMETLSPQIFIPLELEQENLSAFWDTLRKEANIIECSWRLGHSGYWPEQCRCALECPCDSKCKCMKKEEKVCVCKWKSHRSQKQERKSETTNLTVTCVGTLYIWKYPGISGPWESCRPWKRYYSLKIQDIWFLIWQERKGF